MASCASLLVASMVAIVAANSASTAAERIHKTLASPLVDEGTGPDGCTPELTGEGSPANWQVRIERLLPDGKALVETTRQARDNRFPLCIADTPEAANAVVELEFVPHAGTLERVAGIVLRFADAQDYYVVQASVLQRSVRFTRVINGTPTQLARRDVAIAIGRAHWLKVSAVDDLFIVWFNGERMFEARDNQIAAAGRFGIWSKSDSFTSYGDLFITVLN
jgi:hypothetical protein